LHYPDFLQEWYERLELTYGEFDKGKSGFKQFEAAGKYYYQPDSRRLDMLQTEGVTHVFAEREISHPMLRPVLTQGTYTIYKIME